MWTAHNSIRVNHSYLKMCFLWVDNPDLSTSQLKALFQELPLQESTARSYVLAAIRGEKVPFERARLKKVVDHIPEQVARKRYGWAECLSVERPDKFTLYKSLETQLAFGRTVGLR